MKIAIIGAGNVGGALGRKWLKAGHDVVFGQRDVNSAKTQAFLRSVEGNARVAPLAAAAASADVIVLTVPHAAVADVMAACGDVMDGKVVIDTTNKFGAPVVNNVQAILDIAPRATVFRAFNSLGWEVFETPVVGGVQADLFFCGPDGDDRARVHQLIADVGLRPIYVGGLDRLGVVDAAGSLWVTLAFGRGMGRRVALKLIADA